MKIKRSAGKRIAFVAGMALLILWLLATDAIPWRFGTIKSIYGKYIDGAAFSGVSIQHINFMKDLPDIQYTHDTDCVGKLVNYFTSLKLRAMLPVIDNAKGEITHTLRFSSTDSERSIPVFSIDILGSHLIEVSVFNLPNYRKKYYKYIVEDSLDIDYILSCFAEGSNY